MDAGTSSNPKPLRSARFRMAWAGALLAILVSIAADVEARGFGGGGFRGGGGIRGGGSTSMSRGSSSFGRGSYDRGSSSYRSGGTFSRDGSYSKPSALDRKPSALDRPSGSGSGTNWDAMTRVPGSGGSATQLPASRPGGGGSGTQLPSNRPGGGGSAAQLPANRPGGGGSGTQLPADRPGGGGSGTAWRPDCPKCSDGGGGWVDHPIAAGIAIGAIAGAVAIGSTYYYLPPECPPYYWNDIYYYSCDGAFYQPQYEGDTIVYVTVPDPSGGQQQPAK
jgi:hypothetical protein